MNSPHPSLPKIFLAPGKDKSLRRFHPWVFSGAIQRMDKEISRGDVVEVFNATGEYLATGHYEKGSIAVRIFSFTRVVPDYSFWKSKLAAAYELRESLGLTTSPEINVYRLVAAEGDEMPGLIIDYYNSVAVIQAHSTGMHRIAGVLSDALQEIYGNRLIAVYDKSRKTLPSGKNKSTDSYLFGKQIAEHEVLEYGNRFLVDWESGQKTGFYIDQRENRKLLQQYVEGKKVLNAFSYTGGFSVYAGTSGATEIHSVDSSESALELAEKNIQLNGIKNHKVFREDVFDFLTSGNQAYDVVVLDPPAFAKSHRVSHNAIQGYRRLNEEAIRQIKSGGIIFTFSCSQAISRQQFTGAVLSAAINARRRVTILHHMSQTPDHCISIYHPEGEYLKGMVLRVE